MFISILRLTWMLPPPPQKQQNTKKKKKKKKKKEEVTSNVSKHAYQPSEWLWPYSLSGTFLGFIQLFNSINGELDRSRNGFEGI